VTSNVSDVPEGNVTRIVMSVGEFRYGKPDTQSLERLGKTYRRTDVSMWSLADPGSTRLLTIYDLEVEAKWVGKKGEDEVDGTLKITEFGHEAIDGLSEYEVSDVVHVVAGRAIPAAFLDWAHPLHDSSCGEVRFCEIHEPSCEISV
jgi:hypothetical protein